MKKARYDMKKQPGFQGYVIGFINPERDDDCYVAEMEPTTDMTVLKATREVLLIEARGQAHEKWTPMLLPVSIQQQYAQPFRGGNALQ